VIITSTDQTVSISGLNELDAAAAAAFTTQLPDALPAGIRCIDIDLAETEFVDCGGLRALIALRNCARTRNGDVIIRLLNPPANLRRMFDVFKMNGSFEVQTAGVRNAPAPAPALNPATASSGGNSE